jgi:hypothetical protein
MEQIHAECGHLPAAIIGNKTDLADRRRVSFKRASRLAEQLRLPYYETSIDGPSLDSAIEYLAAAIKDVWNLDAVEGGMRK